MKSTGAVVAAIVLVSALTAVRAEETAPTPGLKIGWVDLEKLFRNYYRSEKVLGKLEAELEKKEEEMEGIINRIRTLESEKKLLSTTGRLRKEEEIIKEKLALRELKREADLELNTKLIVAKKKLLEEINEKIEEKARNGNYTFILLGGVIAYKDPRLELTKEILKELNKGQEK